MTLNLKKFLALGVIVAAMFITALGLFYAGQVQAGIMYSSQTFFKQHVEQSFFVATSTTATSTNSSNTLDRTLRLDGADRAVFIFGRGDTKGTGNSGSTNFKVEVSLDGSTWYTYNTLTQNLATSTVQTTLSTVTLTGTSTAAVYMQNLGWHFARCIAVRTTDGDNSCWAAADY